jgi:hypothetical protein
MLAMLAPWLWQPPYLAVCGGGYLRASQAFPLALIHRAQVNKTQNNTTTRQATEKNQNNPPKKMDSPLELSMDSNSPDPQNEKKGGVKYSGLAKRKLPFLLNQWDTTQPVGLYQTVG